MLIRWAKKDEEFAMGKLDLRGRGSVPQPLSCSSPRCKTLEFDNSELQWPFLTSVEIMAAWFAPCSLALLSCQAGRERRKEHEHISKRTTLLLAGCIFQSKPNTAPPRSRSISTTSTALVQRGTSKYNFIPPITFSTKGRATIWQTSSSCTP